ncbi:MAG TPA: hypothetical protein VE981_13180 [Planctomycetota bacterium]|nr:hypothetical protein [Planctomycetota bacterium]
MGPFFLFCNVFRVRRAHELVWAAADRFSWPAVFPAQRPFTLTAIGAEIRSRECHRIGCRRIHKVE